MGKSGNSGTENGGISTESISRRQFLKIAGVAGAALGVGAGLGGLLAACGEEETATTTATAGATTTQATTATTAPASTTTVSVSDEMGREIKAGLVMPETGALAAFGIADVWCTKMATSAIGDGMVLGDDKRHPVNVVARARQSDSNRASQVAADLIQNDNVDLLMGSTTPDVTNPAADQAEALGTPFISSYSPWVRLRVRSRGRSHNHFQVDVRLSDGQRADDVQHRGSGRPDSQQQEGRLLDHEQR